MKIELDGTSFFWKRDLVSPTQDGYWFYAERQGIHYPNTKVDSILSRNLTKAAREKGMTEKFDFRSIVERVKSRPISISSNSSKSRESKKPRPGFIDINFVIKDN